ncbi:hypothetical protein ACFWY5_18155 [Nonomuraea sp. NPDC059007]|uniref:hypothetical protein n=1 Tax=Nonomuraea sp. NPDC059007 TaxID=3346692 RepID=UPI00369B7E9F
MIGPLRRWSISLASAFLAGAVPACSAAPAAPAAPPARSHTAAVPAPGEQARRLTLPFDAYDFSPAENMTLEVAEDLLVRDCLRARGMAWHVLPAPAGSESEPPHRRRYGVIEREIADVFGYHTPPDRPVVAARKQHDLARTAQASPTVRKAADRCLDRARDHLSAGAPNADAGFFNKTIFASFDASQRDEKVTRAFRSWSACMAGEGFPYPDPLTAITDPRWETSQPTPQEIRTAQADLSCKDKTDLVSIWAAAETRIQNDAIGRHPKKFQRLRAVKIRQLEAARRVIDRTRPMDRP